MIGIRNGTEIGYDLREVAEMLGQRAPHCAEGCAFIQKLGEYFRREGLVEMRNIGGGYDIVSGGAIRAYCYDFDLNVPPELSGARPSAEEMPGLWRKMQRDSEAVSVAAPEPALSVAAQECDRRHGGARPETIFIERYVAERMSKGLSLHAMRAGFVRHVGECIEAKDPECPFTKYDPVRSMFTVGAADGGERTLPLANAIRSVSDTEKRIRKRQQRSTSVPSATSLPRNNSGITF